MEQLLNRIKRIYENADKSIEFTENITLEEYNFYKDNIEIIARNLDVIDGAKEYIDKFTEKQQNQFF